jgi:hypothetical protein
MVQHGHIDTTTFAPEKLQMTCCELRKRVYWHTIQLAISSADVMAHDTDLWGDILARCELIATIIGDDAANKAMQSAQGQYRAEVAAKIRGIVPDDILAEWLAGDESGRVMDAVVNALRAVTQASASALTKVQTDLLTTYQVLLNPGSTPQANWQGVCLDDTIPPGYVGHRPGGVTVCSTATLRDRVRRLSRH